MIEIIKHHFDEMLVAFVVSLLILCATIGLVYNGQKERTFDLEMAKQGCNQTYVPNGYRIWDCRKDK